MTHDEIGLCDPRCFSILRWFIFYWVPQVLGKLAALPGGAYGEVALAANQIIDASQQKPFEVQCSEVKEKMKEIEPGQVDILQWIAVGADFLSALLPDEDVARVALEVCVCVCAERALAR